MAQQTQPDPYALVTELIDAYNIDPSRFSPSQVQELQTAASNLGLNFSPAEDPTRWAKNYAWGLGNSISLGFLGMLTPDSWEPDQVTTGDAIAQGAGEVSGFFVPGMIGGKVARGIATLGKAAVAGKELGYGKKVFDFLRKGEVGYYKANQKAAAELVGEAAPAAVEGATTAATAGKKLYGAAAKAAEKKAAAAAAAAPTAAARIGEAEILKALEARGAPKGFEAFQKAADMAKRGLSKIYAEGASPWKARTLEGAIKWGTASGISDIGGDLEEGNLFGGVGRAFGGAALGAVGQAFGGLQNALGQIDNVAAKIGSSAAIKYVAAIAISNMSAPDRAQYPQDFVEELLKNAWILSRR